MQILVKSALTGEMIYSDSYTTPTNVVIAMPEMEKGREYLLEISLERPFYRENSVSNKHYAL